MSEYHLAILFPGPLTITTEAITEYRARELKDLLEQRLRTAGRQPILTLPVQDGQWPVNVTQAITWAVVPEGGTTPW